VLADVIALVRALQDEKPRGAGPQAIGLGVPELVGTGGQLLSEATIRWRDLDVADKIRAATGLPVWFDADVRAAARGEAHFGAGRELRSLLYVTVGTGISSCLVIGSAPYLGARGLTGTFASGDGLIPGMGGELHAGPPLERFAAGPAIASRFAAAQPGFRGAAPDVFRLADAGDSLARSVVESAGRALGAAIAQLVNVLDPEAIVLGGSLGLAEGLYRNSLDESLRDHVWSEFHHGIKLVSAQLGNDAGIIGAALATVQH
jgi:glucokinase